MLLQSEIAGVGRRVMATVLDLVILHLVLSVVTRNMMVSAVAMWVLDFALAVVYSGLFLGLRGQTPGKMALGLRVIAAGEGGLTFGQTFQRSALMWLPIFGVFVLLALLTPEELRQQAEQVEMVEQVEMDPRSAVASSSVLVVGTVGWLWLVHSTRRHPDGQAPHDRSAKTYVVKTPG